VGTIVQPFYRPPPVPWEKNVQRLPSRAVMAQLSAFFAKVTRAIASHFLL